MSKDMNSEVLARLDTVARLLAVSVTRGMKTGECILALARSGLDRVAIAEVCGTTPDTVSVRLSEAKRKARPAATGPQLLKEADNG